MLAFETVEQKFVQLKANLRHVPFNRCSCVFSSLYSLVITSLEIGVCQTSLQESMSIQI